MLEHGDALVGIFGTAAKLSIPTSDEDARALGIASRAFPLELLIGPVSAVSAFAGARVETWHEIDRAYEMAFVDRGAPRLVPGHATTAKALERGFDEWMLAFTRERFAHGGSPPVVAPDELWIWVDEGEPKAMAGALVANAEDVRIVTVYTPPESRGRGYATALVVAITEAFASKPNITLNVEANNVHACRAYERAGFRVLSESAIWAKVSAARMSQIKTIPEGHVTTPRGFRAGTASGGIKSYAQNALDIGILAADGDCVAWGMFTKSTVKGAPVLVTQKHIADQKLRGIVVNSGCANVATGKQGIADAEEMAQIAAKLLGCKPEDMAVCSTGHIGHPLPMDKIRGGLAKVTLAPESGNDLARAIMTTDTKPKHIGASFEHGGKTYSFGGIAKGSGMIHPDMATMFGFLTTDAPITPAFAKSVLTRVVDRTFNMISIDNDTSTSDTVLLLSSGAAGGDAIADGHPAAKLFEEALELVARHLAREIARDGEGATKLLEARVTGAATLEQARAAARTITASPLVKVGVYGNDPNWGRILMAVGRAGAAIDLDKAVIKVGEIVVYADGKPANADRLSVVKALAKPEVDVTAELASGTESAIAWGCDLTEDYVKVKGVYTA